MFRTLLLRGRKKLIGYLSSELKRRRRRRGGRRRRRKKKRKKKKSRKREKLLVKLPWMRGWEENQLLMKVTQEN